MSLSLEDLMAVEITSVAKKPQPWAQAAAAIHVITREDIRRSGVTSVPELLRQVPGMHVARIDGSRYSVSIRGFSGRFSGNLLVLVDGRSIYTPLFSGVYWEAEAQTLPLDDIERIEVIRGPGGSLWGANAVSGVINIVSRAASDTQAGHLQARAGNLERGLDLRHGGTLGEDGYFRIYATGNDRASMTAISGDAAAHDASRSHRAGLRADLAPGSQDSLSLRGDVYRVHAEQTVGVSQLAPTPGTTYVPDTAALSGGNALLRWRRKVSPESDWQLQAYVDRAEVHDAVLRSRTTTTDLEFQHRSTLNPSHELTWGLGYRHVQDQLDGTFTVSFTPTQRTMNQVNAFVQDTIRINDALLLTLGTKLERNGYGEQAWQPSARMAWQSGEGHLIWGALSRALRTPSRADRGSRLNYLVIPGQPFPTVVSGSGSSAFRSETLVAAELGYRGQVTKTLTLDATVFHNDHRHLRTSESRGVTAPPPFVGVVSQSANLGYGTAEGAELSVVWQATPTWRWRSAYSRLRLAMGVKPGSSDTTLNTRIAGSSPESQYQLHSQHSLGDKIDVDLSLYHVGRLAAVSGASNRPVSVAAINRLDARLGWRPSAGYELSLAVQNMFDSKHIEFQSLDTTASAVRRGVFVQLRSQF